MTKKINFISIKIVLENRTFKFLARQDIGIISDINNCLGDKNSLGNSLGLEILTFCLGTVGLIVVISGASTSSHGSGPLKSGGQARCWLSHVELVNCGGDKVVEEVLWGEGSGSVLVSLGYTGGVSCCWCRQGRWWWLGSGNVTDIGR